MTIKHKAAVPCIRTGGHKIFFSMSCNGSTVLIMTDFWMWRSIRPSASESNTILALWCSCS